jgi:hypothetical protein
MRKPAIQTAPTFANRLAINVATISTAKATLWIMGDSLIPEEVTNLLGATPTEAQRKGQELRGSTGISRTAKFGMWRLRATETTPGDLDAQVREIFAHLTDDITVWNRLASQYEIDLYCGWFMEKENEGLGISASTLRELGARSIELSLDIYSGDSDTGNLVGHDSGTPPNG